MPNGGLQLSIISEGVSVMKESDQQILTASIIRELGMNLAQLWIYYQGIGGNADESEVSAYAAEEGSLPPEERGLLALALNEIVTESPWLPRAPYSQTPLAVERGHGDG
jgi:hypothetical protein